MSSATLNGPAADSSAPPRGTAFRRASHDPGSTDALLRDRRRLPAVPGHLGRSRFPLRRDPPDRVRRLPDP